MNNKKYPVTVAPFNFNNFKELSNAKANIGVQGVQTR